MKIVVNGNPHVHAGTGELSALFSELGVVPDQVAVMVNDRIVPRDERASFRLKDGDVVEVLTFMGGG